MCCNRIVQILIKNDVSTAVLSGFPYVLTTGHADVDEELLGESGESVGHSAHGTKKPRSEAGFLV